ncbi:hypothetical protein H0I39_06310 [Ottowia beijingensis]|uniref:Uncharacterized protein n=1 Tax=Ottowia beijingensis TaxID=1207057 RepID=A0A853ILB9_9BURK|nr:hypothetical protein [Ottowia beijingensis]MBP7537192.1 hypothetical protein [Ottowia sp.]NZA01473.1 hypothetical protein [Ottowia beijingensis]
MTTKERHSTDVRPQDKPLVAPPGTLLFIAACACLQTISDANALNIAVQQAPAAIVFA